MKKLVSLFLMIVVSAGLNLLAAEKRDLKGKITVSGAFALYPLMQVWAEQFKKEYPQVVIDISAGGAGKGMTDVLSGLVDLAMVSRDIHPEEQKKGAVAIRVAKDGVVVIVNGKHPDLAVILKRGLKKSELEEIFVGEKITSWNQLDNLRCRKTINVFTRSDSCGAAETFAAFFKKKQEDLCGTGVYGDPGIVEAVRRDIYSVGYCNINFGYDAATLKEVEGIKVVPLDLNEDGKISAAEDFYQTRDSLTAAIAAGRYPSPPARDLYLVMRPTMTSQIMKTFLSWILTSGQQFVSRAGYVNINPEILKSELQKLN